MNNKTLNTTLIIIAFVILVAVIYNQQKTITMLALKSNDTPVIKQSKTAPIGFKIPAKVEKDS